MTPTDAAAPAPGSTPAPPTTSRLAPTGAAVLWASAVLVLALIFNQAGRMADSRAMAEMVSAAGEYTVLTTDGGSEEILYVLDRRSEDLTVYRVDNQRALELLQRVNLGRVFAEARAKAQGRTK